jgi:hypothetical protein
LSRYSISNKFNADDRLYFTGWRVGVKIPQDGNRANGYGHVAVVHEHVWRTLCSVCATGARVAQPVPCNFVVLEVSPAPSPCCFNLWFHWTGTGWCENSTRWKSCKRVQTRGHGAWACLAHALQCLCDGRACCLARALQLVICRSGGFTGTSHCCFNSLFLWDSTGWCENSTRWKSRKQVRARGHGALACLAHGLQCL